MISVFRTRKEKTKMSTVKGLQTMCIETINKIDDPSILLSILSPMPHVPYRFMKIFLKYRLLSLRMNLYRGYRVILNCRFPDPISDRNLLDCLLKLWPKRELCWMDILEDRDNLENGIILPSNLTTPIWGTSYDAFLLQSFRNVMKTTPNHLRLLDISKCRIPYRDLKSTLEDCDPILSQINDIKYTLRLGLECFINEDTSPGLSYRWLDLQITSLAVMSTCDLYKKLQLKSLPYLEHLLIFLYDTNVDALFEELSTFDMPNVRHVTIDAVHRDLKVDPKDLPQRFPSLAKLYKTIPKDAEIKYKYETEMEPEVEPLCEVSWQILLHSVYGGSAGLFS